MKYTIRVNAFDRKYGRPQWCKDNVGVEGVDWDYVAVNNTILEYLFVNESDAVLFALKWL